MKTTKIDAEQALEALNHAALAIAGELESDKVLQQIVDTARELVGARYAALGVPDSDGRLGHFVFSGVERQTASKIPNPPQGMGLLGSLITDGLPIRVRNLQDDVRATGFPAGHPPMVSFLGVPILGVGEILGNLYLTDKYGADEFSEYDQRLLEMLAAHAAIAIQNAHLYEQIERLAVLEERTRIGMDLHDGVIQSIYAVGLILESARLELPPVSEATSQLLDAAVEGLNGAIRDIRNFILDLRPRRFLGNLPQGLSQLVREFQANTMIPVELTVAPLLDDLPTSLSRALFLTSQEALANIARHAQASAVTVLLLRNDTAVSLTISDNGKGFDLNDESRQVGHGLANMQSRAENLGGDFQVISAPGEGATIILRVNI